MKILIVGCGKVGTYIAEELVKEEHDIVLLDSNSDVVSNLSTSLDVLGVIGDAVSLSTLKDASVETCDVLLAVTNSDEINMLCCLFARKANPKIKTIARVRNPVYSKELRYIKDELGLTLIINPEMATAREIARLLRFPAANEVQTFSRGRVELTSFLVPENIANKKVKDFSKNFNGKLLFVGIERNDEIIVPHGETIVLPNDKVSIIAKPSDMSTFFTYAGLVQHPIKSVLMCGGSTIAYYLATSLIPSGIDVKIIEKNKEKCEQLADLLPNATIINGDGTDHNLLIEEGINEADAFVSLTNVDEENVMLSLYANNTLNNKKVVTKVNHIPFDSVMSKLNVGSLVYPKHITADNIITYVRGLTNASSSNITALYRVLDNKAEVMSFKIVKESKLTKNKLMDLDIVDNLLVCAIIRDDDVYIPTGQDKIKVGDIVLIATTNKGIESIEEIVK